MNSRDDSVYLKHILDAIDKIEEFLEGADEERFLSDSLLQSGVIYQIQIIGEAARNISKKLRDKYKGVPWKEIVGMRSKLVHDYFGVEETAVWDTATKDLPKLKKQIAAMLKEIR